MNEDEQLPVRNTDGDIKVLEQIDPLKARKTLGIMQAITGDEKKKLSTCLRKLQHGVKMYG